jgi:hypothetical protein
MEGTSESRKLEIYEVRPAGKNFPNPLLMPFPIEPFKEG